MGQLHELFVSLKLENDTHDGVAGAAAEIGILSGVFSKLTEYAVEGFEKITDAIEDFTKEVINAGLNLETYNWRVKAMFGDSADYVLGRADEISAKLNNLYSPEQIGKLMTQSGMAFEGLGLNTAQTTNLAAAAAAMATIKGTSPQDAMEAIVSSMTSGRTGQLKKYGVDIGSFAKGTTPEERAQEIYGDIEPQTDKLTKKAATYADTGSGQIQVLRTNWEELVNTIGKAFENLSPLIKPFNDMFTTIIPLTERWTAALQAVMGEFNGLGVAQGIVASIKDYFQFAVDVAIKLWEALYDLRAAVILFGESTGIFQAIGTVVGWLYGVFKAAYEGIVNVVLGAAQFLLVAAGMIADSHHSMGEKVGDILKLFASAWINLSKQVWEIVGELAKWLIDMGAKMGVGFANMLIDGVNAGLGLLTTVINNWIKQYNDNIGNKIGASIGSFTAPQVQHVGDLDTSGAKGVIDSLVSTATGMLDGMASKYGLNVTLGDLAKKYGVDLDSFQRTLKGALGSDSPLLDPSTGLPGLNDSIKNLQSAINGKNMSSNINLYFNVSVANASDQTDVQNAGKEIQRQVLAALAQNGIVPTR